MRKAVMTLVAFALVGACVFFAGVAADASVGLPQPVSPASPCPATACASGSAMASTPFPTPTASMR